MARVIALSDTHCGARSGLTPPDWQYSDHSGPKERRRWGRAQREAWETYMTLVEELSPVDVVLFLGDAIDGRQEISGGQELLTPNRQEQVQIAYECLKVWNARHYDLVYGTSYHTGSLEDWEKSLAEKLGGEIGARDFPQIEGVTFDIRHRVGRSQIPHGRATALLREQLWNALWSETQQQPKADIILRGHLHYHVYVGTPDVLCMVLPALQLSSTEYGMRNFSGTVDWGLVSFEVENGRYSWQAHIRRLKSERKTVNVLVPRSG